MAKLNINDAILAGTLHADDRDTLLRIVAGVSTGRDPVTGRTLADIAALATLSHDSTRSSTELTRLLEAVEKPLLGLSDALTHSHFSHAEVPRQLITMRP